MGINFGSILDVSLSWQELPNLPARLDRVTGELSAIWMQSVPNEPSWSLELSAWTCYVAGAPACAEDVECRLHPGLQGPLQFILVPQRAFAVLSHSAGWKWFLQDLSERERLRRSCTLIARALGASRIAYVPDLAIEDLAAQGLYDEAYERIVLHLRQAWGDASSLTSTYAIGDRYWERYLVEEV